MSRSDIVDKGKQTPFQKAGFTVDTVFEVIVNGNFNLGDHLKLKKDDGSESPDFIRLSDGKVSYTYLERIKEYVDPFPHTVYVKFDNYHKEYSYLCDDETASSYKLWRAEALHGEYRVNVETKDGVKTPYVTRLALNKKPPAATKCIIPFTKVRSVLDDYKAEVPVIEVGDVVKRKAEEAVGVLPNTYEVVDINKEGWIKLKGKEQHSYWNTKHFNIVSKKCENTALQEGNTPVKSPLDDVVSIEITDGTNQIHKMSGYWLGEGIVDPYTVPTHEWCGHWDGSDTGTARVINTPSARFTVYPNYSKEEVDKLVEEGKLGAVGLDMWKRTGTINPDFIHPSPSQAISLAEFCKKEYSPRRPWDLGGHCLDGIHPTREAMEAVSQAFAVACKTDPQMIELLTKCKQQEESNMSIITTRRIVEIQLIDRDAGLPVEHSLVGRWTDIVTEDSDSITIQELLLNVQGVNSVAAALAAHNEVREEQTDLQILKSTGQIVSLRPVKLKDLHFIVK